MTAWDYAIVGGGTAGAVLASRLTEDPSVRVVLLEAGRDIAPDRLPADIATLFPLSTFNDAYMWPHLRVHWRRAHTSPSVPFQQGRILGGGGSVMGMWALRGVPEDYDGWAAAGAVGWAWSDVLPFFRRIETDHDEAGPLHGDDGPIPIRRQPPREWSSLATAVHRVVTGLGFPDVDDMNGDFRDGHCLLPISRYPRSRASAAICYLTAAVRRRPNLRVVTEATVTDLVREGNRIAGVDVRRPGGPTERYLATETLLTAGALHTPLLLMRAGIGPAAHLAEHGIQVVANRPGVGSNLQNHPLLPVCAVIPSSYTQHSIDMPPAATYLRWSSAGGSRGDMGLYIRSYLAWHALGRRLALLGPVLMKPRSTGSVRLASAAPDTHPKVEFNFFDHPDDLTRMADGFRLAARILASPDLRAVCGDGFVLTDADRLGRYNRLSRLNAVRGRLAATVFDVSPRAGMALIRRLARVREVASVVDDDAAVSDFVRHETIGTNHVCGTCRMGSSDDPAAVVDPAGRLHGFDGLRVADASIMPSVPSGNTHLPVAMAAEKIAEAIRRTGGVRR